MTAQRDPLALRFYRAAATRLLPPRFRGAYLDDMVAVFSEIDASARRRGGMGASIVATTAEMPGLIALAIRERRVERAMRTHEHTTMRKEDMLESIAQDLRFAGRSLLRSPGFAIVAILTLALGVGANTAIFSVVNAVLLTPLRLHEPNRVIALGEASSSAGPNAVGVTSPANLYDLQSHLRSVQVAGFTGSGGALVGLGDPQQLTGSTSIGGVMEVLGVQPLFGRLLTVADEDPGSAPVIVLTFDGWHRLFGDDRSVLGRTLNLRGVTRTIVGVMPAGFTFPGAPNDFWIPSRFDAAFRANRDQYYIQVVGRLAPLATIEQVRAETAPIASRLAHDWPQFNAKLRFVALPLRDTIVGGVRAQLMVVMGAVAFVLLITCANLGSLLLARASARRREIAIRQALGAGRGRVARQLLTESVVLALTGGAAGLLVGKWFLKVLLAAQATTNLPRSEEIGLDGRVLLFTIVVSIGAGLMFGSIPAWQLARGGSSSALRDGAKGSSGGQWTRNSLVVAELALAMVLLTGAGLLLRSFDLLQRVKPGISPDHVLTFSVSRGNGDASFFQQSLDRIRALPSVRSASIVSQLPITGRGAGAWFNRIDRPLPAGVNPTGEAYRVISPEYFSTVGITIKSGRALTSGDRKEAQAVVINEALAKKYYPNENPLGKLVYLGSADNRLVDNAPIVGIVSDTRDAGLGSDPLPTVYATHASMPWWAGFSFVVRTSDDPTLITSAVRDAIRAINPAVPLRNIQTLDDVLATSVAPARWSTTLFGIFAGVALVMAVLGVFGVLSFIVTQRTRELGIRIALGATSGEVRRMVVMRGLTLVSLGLGLGLIAAVLLTRFLATLLYGVTATDPMTYAGVMTLLAVAAVVASDIPARRATRVDPIIALRAE